MTERRRSPHPGVKVVCRRRRGGSCTWYGRVRDGQGWRDHNLDALGLADDVARRAWALEQAEAIRARQGAAASREEPQEPRSHLRLVAGRLRQLDRRLSRIETALGQLLTRLEPAQPSSAAARAEPTRPAIEAGRVYTLTELAKLASVPFVVLCQALWAGELARGPALEGNRLTAWGRDFLAWRAGGGSTALRPLRPIEGADACT